MSLSSDLTRYLSGRHSLPRPGVPSLGSSLAKSSPCKYERKPFHFQQPVTGYGISPLLMPVSGHLLSQWSGIERFAAPYLVNKQKGSAGLQSKVFFIWGSTCAGCFVFTYFCIPEVRMQHFSCSTSSEKLVRRKACHLNKSTRCTKKSCH